MNKKDIIPFKATHPGEMIKDEIKERANIAKRDSEHQTVTVTIPARDHNLLQELARRFGWACVF